MTQTPPAASRFGQARSWPDLPGPHGLALLETLRFARDPLGYVEGAARRFGSRFRTRWLDGLRRVWFTEPDDVRELFTREPDVFSAGKTNAVVFQSFLGDHSTFVVDGEEHKVQRRLLGGGLRGSALHAHAGTIRAVAERLVATWPADGPFPFIREARALTFEVIARTLFGAESERIEALHAAMVRSEQALTMPLVWFKPLRVDLGPWSPWGRYLRASSAFGAHLEAEIARARSAPAGSRSDVLFLLAQARHEGGRHVLGDVEIRDIAGTLLAAGHDTVTVALTWTIYETLRSQDVRDGLLRELAGLPDDSDARTTAILRAPYLDAVCRESLRLHPPAPIIARYVEREAVVGDVCLAPGDIAMIPIYLIHRRSESFPEPLRFDPTRYATRAFSPFEWLPFGGGYRRCIGEAFALLELKLVLATILLCCPLELVSSEPVGEMFSHISMQPRRPVLVRRGGA